MRNAFSIESHQGTTYWGGVERETWVVGANSKLLGGPRQIRRMLMKQGRRRLSSILDWGHKGCIRRGSKKMAVQVCTELWLHNYAVKRSCHEYLQFVVHDKSWLFHYLQIRLTILTDFYFSQVKNKPWLPWVYSWIRHHCEYVVLIQ